MNEVDQQIERELRKLTHIAQRSCYHSANSIPRNFGKYSGQIRASTRMNIGSVDTSVTLAPVYKRNAITGEIPERERSFRATSRRIRTGDKIFVSNNIPYVENAEFQYGNFAFAKAKAAWTTHVSTAVREAQAIQ